MELTKYTINIKAPKVLFFCTYDNIIIGILLRQPVKCFKLLYKIWGEEKLKKIIVLLMIISLGAGATSCSIQSRYGETQQNDANSNIYSNSDEIMDKGPVKGGTLNLFTSIPDTLNPILTNNAYVQSFSSLIFEGLVKIGSDQKPTPVLSDAWTVSDNKLEWTFHLRDNVFWHDNTPFTAEDVEFTFQTILNTNLNSVYKRNVQNITTFAAIGKSTFRITLKKPNSFTAEMMTFPIIPKHYYLGDEIVNPAKNMAPVGTGSFMFKSYEGEKIIRLTANQNWWNSKGNEANKLKQPYLDEINIKVYEKPDDGLNAFQTRDVDVAFIDSTDYDKYKIRSDLTIKDYPGKDFEFIALNLQNPALASNLVRQAIAYGIDKKRILQETMPGKMLEESMPIIPGTWIYDEIPDSTTRDGKRAKDALLQDGWKDDKGTMYKYIDGRLTYLNFELIVNDDNELRKKIAYKVSEQLKEIGINIQVTPLKWEDEFKKIDSKEFDMTLLGCRVSSLPDISFLYSTPYLYSYSPLAARNISNYSNTSVDGYIEKIFAENDFANRKTMFSNMVGIICNDVPYIGLFSHKNAVIYSKKIRGNLDPYAWDKLNNISEWYIPEK